MRQHGALASARGAAGVQNSSQVVGILKHHLVLIFLMRSALKQGACSIVIQSEHMLRACFECNFADPSKIGSRTHHHRWLGVANEVFNFRTLVGGVERQKNITRSKCCQVEHDRLYRLLNLHRNATALGQVQAIQQIGHHGTGPI